ncbi:MAG: energy-coupled thiamine transporter ThiT [Christensenellales bacterium]
MNSLTRRMVESALMVAIGTVLSLLSFQGPWALGGSITICSMLPLVFIAYRHGTRWGLFCGFLYAGLQMMLGFKNVGYGRSMGEMLLIALLDYILAFTVIGLSSIFKGRFADERKGLMLGIFATFLLRFLCHFFSGWFIWEALWPNALGYAAPAWSFLYNGSYMLPELLVTALVAWLSFRPLKGYWLGLDLGRKM